MSFFYRILFLAILLALGSVWWRGRERAARHEAQVAAMAEILDRAWFGPETPAEVVNRQFFRALIALADYRILREKERVEATDAEFLEEALQRAGTTDADEIRLIVRSLTANLLECQRRRLIDDPRTALELFEGKGAAAGGAFRGDMLVIARRIPAELAPHAWNHPANFTLMPATAAAMIWPYSVTDEILRAAVDLKTAGVITEQTWQEIKSRHDEASAVR